MKRLGCPEGVFGECDPRCCHLPGASQAEDYSCHRHGQRSKAPWPYSVWIWRLNPCQHKENNICSVVWYECPGRLLHFQLPVELVGKILTKWVFCRNLPVCQNTNVLPRWLNFSKVPPKTGQVSCQLTWLPLGCSAFQDFWFRVGP